MQNLLFAVLVAGPLAAGAVHARAASGLGATHPIACAGGYHLDAGGNCQPDIAEVSRFCAPGLAFEPDFYGWRCVPAPKEAY